MKWFFLLVTTIVVMISIYGCGARMEVAKDKVLKQIDYYLGETDVQKKEIEIAIKNMERAIEELTKGKIEAKVKLERLNSHTKEVEQREVDANNALVKLRDYLSADKSQVIAGKTYDTDKIQQMASEVISAKKSLSSELESMKRVQTILENAVVSLEKRQNSASNQLATLKNQLREIESESIALNSLKDAARIAGDNDSTLADNFRSLQTKINALHDKTKVGVIYEEEKWKVQDAKNSIDSVDKIISATKSSSDTVAEINSLLKK